MFSLDIRTVLHTCSVLHRSLPSNPLLLYTRSVATPKRCTASLFSIEAPHRPLRTFDPPIYIWTWPTPYLKMSRIVHM